MTQSDDKTYNTDDSEDELDNGSNPYSGQSG